MSTTPRVPRLRVAFFQRIFAHYQAGLVRELGQNSEHEYHFFGDDHDPLGSGIEPIPAGLCTQVTHTVCRTVHWGECLAFQWRAVYEALFGDFEAYILEGSFTVTVVGLMHVCQSVIARMSKRNRGSIVTLAGDSGRSDTRQTGSAVFPWVAPS